MTDDGARSPVRAGQAPRLAARRAPEVADEVARRLAAFVPGWRPGDGDQGGPAAALVQVFARYVEAVEERLDRAPDKNKLAFLDLLGVNPLPAQAARAPVVFLPMTQVGDGRAPAGTRVGATVEGRDEPLHFETEDAVAVAAAALAEVVAVWPGRDAAADHSEAAAARTPFRLFDRPARAEHALFLASDSHFALAGAATVSVEVHLESPSDTPLDVAWEYWDGKVWRGFPDFTDTEEPGAGFDGTHGFTRSGRIRLVAECAATEKTTVAGVEAYWVRGRLRSPLLPAPTRRLPVVSRIRVRTEIDRSLPAGAAAPGTLLDAGFNDGISLDLTKTVFPFGPAPQPGAACYLSAPELFSRPGADATLRVESALLAAPTEAGDVVWEYWNGETWRALAISGSHTDLVDDDNLTFTVPRDAAERQVNGVDGWWVRARVVSGGFGEPKTATLGTPEQDLTWFENRPPVVSSFAVGYLYRSPWAAPDRTVVQGDFRFHDRTAPAGAVGSSFEAFVPVSDRAPTLYLGFDKPLPADRIGVYVEVAEAQPPRPAPVLVWEWWDGATWRPLAVDDETAHLSRPGIVSFVAPSDSVAFDRFGTPRHWVRARLRDEGDAPRNEVRGMWLNAVWASQVQTTTDETVGSSNGRAGQAFFLRQRPVLAGQVIEVRELDGARAAVELPALERELAAAGFGDEDVRVVRDRRTDRVNEVWVRWQERGHLLFSGPGDRHYTIDRASGRVLFGTGLAGRIPPAGVDNIRARAYRAGGGAVGNVGAGAVDQLLAGVLAQGVTNPRAAEGGADGEPVSQVGRRGPLVTRHRRQAVTVADYEALAREASPAVAVARVLAETRANGLPGTGYVKVIVAPHSADPEPQPSYELRRQVRRFLDARVPAGVAGRVHVAGPDYLPIGAQVTVAAVDPGDAGPLLARVRATLAGFLHPLTGGPDGDGWPFGRSVFLSDVAAVLERTPGVDYVSELVLLAHGVPQGEEVRVPPDRIAVAGGLRVRVETGEG